MPYNFAADSFHIKKLCSRLSSSEVHFLMKIGRFAFLRPSLGDLGATYDDHLRPPTNHSSSQNTRINVLSYGIKIWTDLSTVLSQFTRVTDRRTDRRTDRILIARPRLHSMQRGKKSSEN